MSGSMLGLLPGCPEGLPGTPVEEAGRAEELGLSLVLGWHEERLSLWRPDGRETPLSVSFSDGKQGYRLTPERVRHERLIKALGKPRQETLTVLDATAGLGRDAALIAMAGFPVLLAERSPILHAMLADGLQRAPGELAEAMQLLPCADADTHSLPPLHAVYLDPMFPSRDKSAAVKKDLQWLQQLAAYPDQQEETALLEWALGLDPQRVVVKRPGKAEPLAKRRPHHQIAGKAIRFDVYE
ncbi:16S rRNA methyltransferase [Alcanivorax sp. HI0033]|uniref:class I SAM-dependent methyltransferase n=1 Tax=unclassified Alcanivorax TaxID=2638842 RepID=UPI0007B894C0|nr:MULTISPECIES: class I SAM-dependent methyltransferase [unclassified Alcanivorax]KZX79333.1 16S rRNA methyltransferase [Alcanivorax sp. HI0013]KZX79715.1 16S rRNA methyltransferase [Alcanivorax sp. HI0011]KZY23122.1 16S rRNA methyltransferase [Alcanivorax sp. HI0035]KZX71067.1 16S rRNA methyltransferase [Alcanivorax sp. HI0003]KZX71588.1 16S rRNA methyltransferase [Alcanivorax sp. HI0007]